MNFIKMLKCLNRSAHLIAQYRPRAVIMAVTRSLDVARQMHLYRGCCPVYIESTESRISIGTMSICFLFLLPRSTW